MANSYGFDGNIPEGALYGVYDTENGEWTGRFFFDEDVALEASEELNDERLGIVSTTDEQDWL